MSDRDNLRSLQLSMHHDTITTHRPLQSLLLARYYSICDKKREVTLKSALLVMPCGSLELILPSCLY